MNCLVCFREGLSELKNLSLARSLSTRGLNELNLSELKGLFGLREGFK